MNAKISPGPYRVVRSSDYTGDPDDTTIQSIEAADGTVILFTDGGYFKPKEENARAIEAIPELIEALRDAIGTIRYLRPERYDDEEHERYFNAGLDRLCAAYEKATGEKI